MVARDLLRRLLEAVDKLDEPAMQALVDDVLAALTVETALRDVVLPLLAEIGERWARGEMSVAHEHFASSVLRGRLLGLARGWAQGSGPRALLACPGDEQHDLALVAFGIALSRLGWRVSFLGGAAPVETIARAAEAVAPRVIVLALTTADVAVPVDVIAQLARRWRLQIAGRAATAALAQATGAELLEGDPVSAARVVAQ